MKIWAKYDVVVTIIAIFLASLLVYNYTNRPAPIVRTITKTIEIKVPIMKTIVKQVYITQRITSDVSDDPNLTLQGKADMYDHLLKENLIIETSPIDMIEANDGHVYISEFVTGTVTLQPLIWLVTIDLKPKETYRMSQIPVELGYVFNHKLNPDLGLVLNIPFFPNLDVMAGISEANICYTDKLTKYSNWRLGVSKGYDNRISLVAGVKTKLF